MGCTRLARFVSRTVLDSRPGGTGRYSVSTGSRTTQSALTCSQPFERLRRATAVAPHIPHCPDRSRPAVHFGTIDQNAARRLQRTIPIRAHNRHSHLERHFQSVLADRTGVCSVARRLCTGDDVCEEIVGHCLRVAFVQAVQSYAIGFVEYLIEHVTAEVLRLDCLQQSIHGRNRIG